MCIGHHRSSARPNQHIRTGNGKLLFPGRCTVLQLNDPDYTSAGIYFVSVAHLQVAITLFLLQEIIGMLTTN